MGPYRILSEIGRGGMGIVYEAVQVDLDRRVALKVLHAPMSGPVLARFNREIEVLSGLAHPNVVRFYDNGELEGRRYFSMALVKGENLWDVLMRHPFPLQKAASLVAEVADALAYLHASGVSHRDVKPANLILTPDDRLVLVDFGLAVSQEATAYTAHGHISGTIPYLAPECLEHGDRGVAQDVFALALTFHELVTGQACYAACDLAELCRRKLAEPPPGLEQALGSAPSWILELQDRALAPDPGARVTAAGYRDGLRRGASGKARPPARVIQAPRPPLPGKTGPGRLAAACAGTAVGLTLLLCLFFPGARSSRSVAPGIAPPAPVAPWTLAARISGDAGPGWRAELVAGTSILAAQELAERTWAVAFPRTPPSVECRIRLRDAAGDVRAESPPVRTPQLVRVTNLAVVPADRDVQVDLDLAPPAAILVELVRCADGATLASIRETTPCTQFQHVFGNLLPDSEYALKVTPFHGWGGLASYRFSTLGEQHARTVQQLVSSDLRGSPAQLALALEYLRSNPDRRIVGTLLDLFGVADTPQEFWLRKVSMVAGELRSRALADRLHPLLARPLDGEARLAIVRALALARHPGASGAALDAWAALPDARDREALSTALALSGGASACDRIASVIGASGDPGALASLMARAEPLRARTHFGRWIAAPDERDRFVAGTLGLSALGSAEDVQALREVLQRSLPASSRAWVADALADVGTSSARDALLMAFQANPRSSDMLWAVARLGIPAAAATLSQALEEATTAPRRREVLVAIGLVGATGPLEPIARALDDPDPEVRDAAAWSLARLQASHLAGAVRALAGTERDRSGVAAWATGELGDRGAIPALAALRDRLVARPEGQRPERLARIALALARLGGAPASRALHPVWTAGANPPGVRVADQLIAALATDHADGRLRSPPDSAAWLAPAPASLFPRAVSLDALPLQRALFPFVPYDRTGLVLRAGESVSITVDASLDLAGAITNSEWSRRFGATGATRFASSTALEPGLFALAGGRCWKIGAKPVRIVALQESELLVVRSRAYAASMPGASTGTVGGGPARVRLER